MKHRLNLALIFLMIPLLHACISMPVKTAPLPNKQTHLTLSKNPKEIALFHETETPHAAYRIIGTAKVAKYNLFGMRRARNTLELLMKKMAATLGGDGVIAINEDQQHIQGRVIAYQKILL